MFSAIGILNIKGDGVFLYAYHLPKSMPDGTIETPISEKDIIDNEPVDTTVPADIGKDSEEHPSGQNPGVVTPTDDTIDNIEKNDHEIKDHILKETKTVADDYFSDCLFIGDSRMLGLYISCQNTKATFYAAVGLSVNQLNTKKAIKSSDGTSVTVMDAIKINPTQFKRIYMMFGLNELGWCYPSVFIRSVKGTIDQLRELYPDAEICIMSIMPVSSDATVSEYTGTVANDRIREYNSMLLKLADEANTWYLDTYTLFADETGCLPPGYSSDGVHLYSEHNNTLMNYISTHAFAS